MYVCVSYMSCTCKSCTCIVCMYPTHVCMPQYVYMHHQSRELSVLQERRLLIKHTTWCLSKRLLRNFVTFVGILKCCHAAFHALYAFCVCVILSKRLERWDRGWQGSGLTPWPWPWPWPCGTVLRNCDVMIHCHGHGHGHGHGQNLRMQKEVRGNGLFHPLVVAKINTWWLWSWRFVAGIGLSFLFLGLLRGLLKKNVVKLHHCAVAVSVIVTSDVGELGSLEYERCNLCLYLCICVCVYIRMFY
jgi:hypothetical protein